MGRAANSSWLHGPFTAAGQMCAHGTCVHGLSGGEGGWGFGFGPFRVSLPRRSCQGPRRGVKWPVGYSVRASFTAGTAGSAEGRKGRLHEADVKTRVRRMHGSSCAYEHHMHGRA